VYRYIIIASPPLGKGMLNQDNYYIMPISTSMPPLRHVINLKRKASTDNTLELTRLNAKSLLEMHSIYMEICSYEQGVV
jgi:hypothetical protein